MHHRLAVHVALLALACSSALGALEIPAPDAERYLVCLSRPLEPGMRLELTSRATTTTTHRVEEEGNEFVEEFDFTFAYFHGLVDIVATDEAGRPTEALCHVLGSTLQLADLPEEFLPAGTQIHMKRDDEGRVTLSIDEEEVPSAVREILEDLLPLKPVRRLLDDRICPCEGEKAIGESWKIDPDRTCGAILELRELGVKPEQVSGKVTLADVREVDGEACLDVIAELTVSDFQPADLEEGFAFRDQSATVRCEGLFPVGHEGPRLSERVDLSFEGRLVHETEEGEVPVAKVEYRVSTETEIKVVPKVEEEGEDGAADDAK